MSSHWRGGIDQRCMALRVGNDYGNLAWIQLLRIGQGNTLGTASEYNRQEGPEIRRTPIGSDYFRSTSLTL